MAPKFTRKDMRGVVGMNPTPSTPNASSWRETMSVDLKTAERLFNLTLNSGVAGYALCGTTGECAALLWEEKLAYIKTAVETVKGRGYVFAGATALGTKEVIRQARAFRDIGADGLFVGLPLWQTPTAENSVAFYQDIGEAVPDMGIMIYSNASFFKSDFPHEFWAGIGKRAATVVTNKITYSSKDLMKDIEACPNVQFLPGLFGVMNQARKYPGVFHGAWSTQASPEPLVAAVKAVEAHDLKRMDEIEADVKTLPPFTPRPAVASGPPANWTERMEGAFAHYNAQAEREGWNAQDYLKGGLGPPRPPYRDLPDDWKQTIGVWAKASHELSKKYISQSASK